MYSCGIVKLDFFHVLRHNHIGKRYEPTIAKSPEAAASGLFYAVFQFSNLTIWDLSYIMKSVPEGGRCLI